MPDDRSGQKREHASGKDSRRGTATETTPDASFHIGESAARPFGTGTSLLRPQAFQQIILFLTDFTMRKTGLIHISGN